uniref:Presequence translocated-associated motor subunit PAM17 n=1 Tax=Blastobotrys adeninivorans TaxID=409370 RepID=A0A060SXM5_BLAAD
MLRMLASRSILRAPSVVARPLSVSRISSSLLVRRGIHAGRPLMNAAPKPQGTGAAPLTWNDFLALRTKRRRVNVVVSVVSTAVAAGLGWGVLANMVIDPTEMIMGFDPFMVISLAVVLCGAGGYLIGPSIGNVVFLRMIGKQAPTFVRKEADFLAHIRKNRPDPSQQSYANPVTDYYGEKIGSLKDYRRWLRDGRAYRRKTQNFL